MKKLLPWLFLTLLIAIGAFIGGIQYGKNVQDVNEALEYIQANMPKAASPQPTPAQKPLGFRTYTDDQCNISFILPDSLTQASNEAGIQYMEADNPVFEYACSASDEADLVLKDSQLSASELVVLPLLEEEITASTSAGTAESDDGIYYFFLEQENNLVELRVQQRYLPLISDTLQLVNE